MGEKKCFLNATSGEEKGILQTYNSYEFRTKSFE